MKNCVHVYPQFCQHEPAFIFGDREGLIRLRDAIDRTLAEPSDAVAHADIFTADGEGYCIVALCLESEEMHQLLLPYQDEFAPKAGVVPWDLLKFEWKGDDASFSLADPQRAILKKPEEG